MDADRAIFDLDDDDALSASDLHGIEDMKAGRVISHEAVMRWLKSWGTGQRLPRPKCGE